MSGRINNLSILGFVQTPRPIIGLGQVAFAIQVEFRLHIPQDRLTDCAARTIDAIVDFNETISLTNFEAVIGCLHSSIEAIRTGSAFRSDLHFGWTDLLIGPNTLNVSRR